MYYFQGQESLYNRLHPLTKLVYFLIIFTSAITVNHPIILAILLFITLLNIIALRGFYQWKVLLPFFITAIGLLSLINIVFNTGGVTVLLVYRNIPLLGRLIITWENIFFSLVMALRFIIVFSVFIFYQLAIDSHQMLSFFSTFFPRSTILISLTTKTIPHSIKRLNHLKEIQACRGVNYEDTGYITKVKNTFPLIKALTINALEESFSIGQSIQIKGYGVGKRTNYYKSAIGLWDIGFNLINLLILTLIGIVYYRGYMSFKFYPRIGQLIYSSEQAVLYSFIGILLVLPVIYAWGWARCQTIE